MNDTMEPCSDCGEPVIWDEEAMSWRHLYKAPKSCWMVHGNGATLDAHTIPPLSWPHELLCRLFDAGRIGQSIHYLWLSARGGHCPRRTYLRSVWITLKHGPQY